jgi:GNAT superfamily N-acetyltransferase
MLDLLLMPPQQRSRLAELAAAPVARRGFDVMPEPAIAPGLPAMQAQSAIFGLDPVDDATPRLRGQAPQTVSQTAQDWDIAQMIAGGSGGITLGTGRAAATVGPAGLRYRTLPNGRVLLEELYVPPDARGQGAARAALREFNAAADRAGKTVELIPEPQEAGVDLARLRALYAGEGYRGRYETMTRKPQR